MKSEVDRYKDNTIIVQQVRQGKFPAISGLHAEAAVATLLGNLPPHTMQELGRKERM